MTLAQAGIAAFRTPEACADAFHAFFSWRIPKRTGSERPVEWPKEMPAKGKLTEFDALKLFAALGVPVVESAIASRQEFESKAKSLAKKGEPLLVQCMETGLAEAIIGYRDDPVVGPLAMVGAGGILAELYNDVVLRLALCPGPPVREAEANPVIVKQDGVVAVDAIAVMKEE